MNIFRRSRSLTISIILLSIIVFLGFTAGVLTDKEPLRTGYAVGLTAPSSQFPMGTDQLGRDIFSWTLYGIRTALFVSTISTGLTVIISILIGLPAGYFGGKLDQLLMRVTDFFLSIPRFILIIFAVIIFGPTLTNIILILSAFSWPTIARIVRAEVLSIKEREYVQAAKVLGAGNLDIMFNEILPNVMPPVLVAAALQMSDAILAEAGLSFLGLGDPNTASWGRILAIARQAIYVGGWWTLLFPSLFITATVLSVNLLADGLNDIFNPKSVR
ncbi:MAG: ABC transporter permease [Nitrososphaeria archaeon]|nr:ABC transporter permease [Nitrososphaeria archaeon]